MGGQSDRGKFVPDCAPRPRSRAYPRRKGPHRAWHPRTPQRCTRLGRSSLLSIHHDADGDVSGLARRVTAERRRRSPPSASASTAPIDYPFRSVAPDFLSRCSARDGVVRSCYGPLLVGRASMPCWRLHGRGGGRPASSLADYGAFLAARADGDGARNEPFISPSARLTLNELARPLFDPRRGDRRLPPSPYLFRASAAFFYSISAARRSSEFVAGRVLLTSTRPEPSTGELTSRCSSFLSSRGTLTGVGYLSSRRSPLCRPSSVPRSRHPNPRRRSGPGHLLAVRAKGESESLAAPDRAERRAFRAAATWRLRNAFLVGHRARRGASSWAGILRRSELFGLVVGADRVEAVGGITGDNAPRLGLDSSRRDWYYARIEARSTGRLVTTVAPAPPDAVAHAAAG